MCQQHRQQENSSLGAHERREKRACGVRTQAEAAGKGFGQASLVMTNPPARCRPGPFLGVPESVTLRATDQSKVPQ